MITDLSQMSVDFDPKLPGYEYQSFQGMSVEEVLEKIREEGE